MAHQEQIEHELPDLPDGFEWLIIAVPIGPDATPSQVQREVSRAAVRQMQQRRADVVGG